MRGAAKGSAGLITLWLGATACMPHAPVPAPDVPEGTRTLLVEVRSGPQAELWAFDATAPWQPPTIALPADAELTAYAYPESPESLQIELGVWRELRPNGRELPAAPWTAQRRLDAEGWTVDQPSRSPSEQLWLPAFDGPACWAKAGCLDAPADTGRATRCQVPCAIDELQTPALPEMPRGPGWQPETTLGPFGQVVHAPVMPAPVTCEGSDRQPYGAATCVASTACPADWPAAPTEANRARHVDPQAGPSGDGSTARPFSSLSEALARSLPGDAILLRPGTYLVDDGRYDDRHIVGGCPAQTVLMRPSVTQPWVVNASRASFRGLTLPGMRLTGTQTTLQDVEWRTLSLDALRLIDSSSASVRRALVRGGVSSGLVTLGGSTLLVEDTVIEQVARHAVQCDGGASVTVRRTAIRALLGGDRGAGIRVNTCTLSAAGVLIEASNSRGIEAKIRADVEVRDLVIRDLVFAGLVVEGDSDLEVRRALIERIERPSVRVVAGARADLEDVIVRDQTPYQTRGLLQVEAEATLKVRRAFLRPTSTHSLLSSDIALRIELYDTTVDARDSSLERALWVQGGGAIFERVAVAVDVGVGIETTAGNWLTFVAQDLTVRGGDIGLRLQRTTNFDATRAHLTGATQVGLQIGQDTRVSGDHPIQITDLHIEGVRSGAALQISGHSVATLRRFRLDSSAVGARVNAEASLDLAQGAVRGNRVGAEYVEGAHGPADATWIGVRFEGNDRDLAQVE